MTVKMLCLGGLATVLAAGSARANLLLDGTFEFADGGQNASAGDVAMAGTTPWSGWNNWVAPYSGYYSAAHAYEGTQAAKTYSGPNAGIYQSVPVTAGNLYTASAWFLNSSGDQITSANATEDVRMTFYDSTGAAIGDPFISNRFVPASTVDAWTQLSVSGSAPTGATSVTVMMFLNNPDYGGGAMFVDSVSLTAAAIPEPGLASLAVTGVAAALVRRRR